MESNMAQPSAEDAARLLRSHDETRDRAEQRTPSRAFALFTVWCAAFTAVYVALFLLSFGSPALADTVGAGTYGLSLMVLPTLIFGYVVSGARDRFGVRTKPSPGYWVAYSVIVAGFLALLVSMIVGVVYPWWLNLLVPAALFVVMAAGPIRLLRRARTPEDERWVNEPLTRPARWMTALTGVALGALAATSTTLPYPVVYLTVSVLILGTLIGYRSRWGLPRAGFEWGPIHWTAFGITVGILFAQATLLARTEWITTWIAVALGVVAAAVMVVAALLPGNPRRR